MSLRAIDIGLWGRPTPRYTRRKLTQTLSSAVLRSRAAALRLLIPPIRAEGEGVFPLRLQ
jgi:hypothetical protein